MPKLEAAPLETTPDSLAPAFDVKSPQPVKPAKSLSDDLPVKTFDRSAYLWSVLMFRKWQQGFASEATR